MKSSIVDIPWKHYLLSNCLTTEDFNIVSDYSLTLKAKKDSNLFFIESYKDIPNRLHVPNRIKNILNDLGKRCAELLKISKPYEIYSGIMILKPDYRYNLIHTDSEWKTATLVLGLSDTGTGTSLYETDGQTFNYTTPYIKNGGMIFERNNETYHDYDSVGCKELRRTAMIWIKT